MKKLSALIIAIVILLSSIPVVFGATYSYGDIDCNGKIDVIDATTVQRFIAKIINMGFDSVESADVDGDGKVSVMDCTSIQQYVAKVIGCFPCEKESSTEPTEETIYVNTDSSLKPSPSPSDTTTPSVSETEQPSVVETQEPTIDKEQYCREMEKEILRLVNVEREKEGLEPVAFAEDYYDCARVRVSECLCLETFSHTRPDGRKWSTVFTDLSVPKYWQAGENIALNFTTAEEVVAAWMDSPGHRANILHAEFDYLAVGVAETRDYEDYYAAVQLFIASVDSYYKYH